MARDIEDAGLRRLRELNVPPLSLSETERGVRAVSARIVLDQVLQHDLRLLVAVVRCRGRAGGRVQHRVLITQAYTGRTGPLLVVFGPHVGVLRDALRDANAIIDDELL